MCISSIDEMAKTTVDVRLTVGIFLLLVSDCTVAAVANTNDWHIDHWTVCNWLCNEAALLALSPKTCRRRHDKLSRRHYYQLWLNITQSFKFNGYPLSFPKPYQKWFHYLNLTTDRTIESNHYIKPPIYTDHLNLTRQLDLQDHAILQSQTQL